MASTVFNFTSATTDTPGGWNTPTQGLTFDTLYAENQTGSGYLHLKTPDTSIPVGGTQVVGMEVEIRAGIIGESGVVSIIYGYSYDLEIALSKDGANPVGTSKFISVPNPQQVYTIGGITDLWGTTWTPAEVNGMALLIRRPPTSPIPGQTEDMVQWRKVDYGKAIVYHQPTGGTFVAERESVKQKILFGKETTHGTQATCTNRLQAARVSPSPQADFKSWRPQGNKAEQLQMMVREWSSSNLSGYPTYDEMGYILASVIAKPQTSGGVAGSLNTHIFRYDNRYEQDFQTYTIEYGTPDSRAHRVQYAFFDGFGINITRDNCELNGSLIAQAITDGATMSTGVAEVQTFTVTGSPTGGTFKLRFKGAETTAITYTGTGATDATAIQTALNALATIGASGVAVVNTSGQIFTITFSGTSLIGQQQPMIEFSKNSFTGGTSPNATIVETTPGGFGEDALVPILPGHFSVYLASTYAGLSAGKLTKARMANFSIGNRADAYWVLDASNTSFLKHTESPITVKVNLELQADSNGMALLTNARTATGTFLRIEAVGPLISGSDYHTLTIDMYAKVSALGNLEDADGVYQMNYELTMAEEQATWGNSLVVTLKNGKASY